MNYFKEPENRPLLPGRQEPPKPSGLKFLLRLFLLVLIGFGIWKGFGYFRLGQQPLKTERAVSLFKYRWESERQYWKFLFDNSLEEVVYEFYIDTNNCLQEDEASNILNILAERRYGQLSKSYIIIDGSTVVFTLVEAGRVKKISELATLFWKPPTREFPKEALSIYCYGGKVRIKVGLLRTTQELNSDRTESYYEAREIFEQFEEAYKEMEL